MSQTREKSRIVDFHIHTSFSDGYFQPYEVIEEAIRKNLSEICITDHYSAWKPALRSYDLEEYYNELINLRNKYSSQIKIFSGIEVDVTSPDSFVELVGFKWDFILFEYVFSDPSWETTFQKIINFKKKHANYNIGLAHTRFIRVSETKFEHIQNVIRKFNIIIELNTNYRNYMDRWFNYFDNSFLYSVGSDAHNLTQVGNIEPALYYMKTHNISFDRIINL